MEAPSLHSGDIYSFQVKVSLCCLRFCICILHEPGGKFFCASSCQTSQQMTEQGSMGDSPTVKHLLNPTLHEVWRTWKDWKEPFHSSEQNNSTVAFVD